MYLLVNKTVASFNSYFHYVSQFLYLNDDLICVNDFSNVAIV